MISRLSLLAILALTIPVAAPAQPPEGNRIRLTVDASGYRPGSVHAGEIAVRGRVGVVRGPRGRVRTFVYRGRTLHALRRPAFVFPRGFAYRRWRAGEFLPAALIATPYFFLEYEELGLRAPPPGYRWVRYGPDVVLVNERTRQIDEVAPDAIDESDD